MFSWLMEMCYLKIFYLQYIMFCILLGYVFTCFRSLNIVQDVKLRGTNLIYANVVYSYLNLTILLQIVKVVVSLSNLLTNNFRYVDVMVC